jgi:hypothetical protein
VLLRRAERVRGLPSEDGHRIAALDFDTFAGEVRKRRSGRRVLSGAGVRRLRDEFDRTIPALQGVTARSSASEAVIAEPVFRAYGLDQAAVELPRVPGAAPSLLLRAPDDVLRAILGRAVGLVARGGGC